MIRRHRRAGIAVGIAILACGGAWSQSAPVPTRTFAIPAGKAPDTLDEFSRQGGVQIVYLIDNVRGERTNAVAGELLPSTALERLLDGTALMMHRDPSSGAMIVSRRAAPDVQVSTRRHARPPPAAADIAADQNTDDVVVLSAFTVSAQASDRYRAAEANSSVRVRTALIDTPASVSVATREMIDDLAPTRIFDVTRYLAGVQDGRGLQFQDRVIIRGFESNGQRSVDNFLQPDDADNIDEAIIERIEVTKGPNAILSPAGAPGGSMNVVTKSPLFRRQHSVTALVGLFDAQKLTVDLAGPLSTNDAIAYRVIGSVQDSRRYWARDARLRGRMLAPMVSWRLSDSTLLTMKFIGAEHWVFREPLVILDPTVTVATRQPRLGPGIEARSRNGIQPWSHVGTHTADLFAQLTTVLGDNVEMRIAANGRHYFEDSEQNFLSTPTLANRYDPATGELTQDYTWSLDPATGTYVPTFAPFYDPTNIPNRADRQATTRHTGNVQADLVVRYDSAAVSAQTVGGLAFSRRTAHGRGHVASLPGINLYAPARRVTPVYPEDELSFVNQNSFTNWHAYLNQRIGLADNRVQFSAGLLNYVTTTRFRNDLAGTPVSVLDDHKAVWTAGVLWKPRPEVSLYYSRSTNSSPVIANDLPLWRNGVQDEIGGKSEWLNGRLALNAAWFRIEQTNVTIPNPARQTDPAAPETLVSDYGNDGFEIELLGQLTSQLSVLATFSRLHMRDSLGRRVRGVADNHAALLLHYHFAPDHELSGLALTLGVNFSGRRAGDVPINFTPLGVVGRTSFFLEPACSTMIGASYRWGERYQIRLNVDNVLDEKHFIVVAGGRVSGTGITTQPGINVKLATTVQF